MSQPWVQLNGPTARRPPPFDALLAVGLTVFCMGVSGRLADTHDVAELGRGPWMYAGVALTCLPLALRRVRPLLALALSTLGLGLYLAVGSPGGPTYAVPLIAVYTVGFLVRRPPLWMVVAASSVVILVTEMIGQADSSQWEVLAFWPLWVLAAMFVGLGGRNRYQQIAADAARVREWEEAQQAAAQRQVAEERLRIARDIHDVVAHSLASITVLAGAGMRVAETDPAAAKRVLEDIRTASADALGEVRTTIGDLRSGSTPSPAVHGDLGGLVAQMSAAGVEVRTDVTADLSSLDEAGRVTVYRVVQESLTNALRHSGSTVVELVVRVKGDGVEVVLRDHGRGTVGLADHGSVRPQGHGLVGMGERVNAVGGILDASDHPDGGFCVTAWIPDGALRVGTRPPAKESTT
ncbi:MAG: sensor histidine kinase [Acidimicrobiales bacterium]